ncbi:MAG: T9SS type A sorting domain-containing protein, partial [Chitinophagales bacterium]
IYPNPSSDKIIISLSSNPLITDHSLLILTDLSGKTISEINITSPDTEIDVSAFPAGIYFVRMMIDGEQFIQKLIIER